MKLFLALLIACVSFAAEACGTSGRRLRMHHFRPSRCYACSHRSLAASHECKHANPCPSTGKSSGDCPGYVIEHVRALKHRGADASWNMQWQTKAAAKAKDKVE